MGDFAPTDLPSRDKRQFACCSCVFDSTTSEKPKRKNAPRTGGNPSSERARLTLTAPDPRTHAQTWLKTKKRLARPSSRLPPTKRSPRRTGASTRRTKISRPPDSRFPSLEASSSPPHLFPQGVPLPQEPQRRQGRRRRQQPGVRPRVQLHARLPRRLPQPFVDVDQEDRGALSRGAPKTLVSNLRPRLDTIALVVGVCVCVECKRTARKRFHQNRVKNKQTHLHTACTYVSLSSELRRALHRVAPRVPAHDLPRQAHLPAQHQHGHLARAERAACGAPDAAHVL